jgi:DNA-binding NarL/FixJ family response regulator
LESRLISAAPPDLVISRIDGSDVVDHFLAVKRIRLRYPKTRWIVLGCAGHAGTVDIATSAGVDGFLIEDAPLEMLQLLTDLILLGHSSAQFGLAKLNVKIEATGQVRKLPRVPSPSFWDGATTQPFVVLTSAPDDGDIIKTPESTKNDMVRLSNRESEILSLVANGSTNKSIARSLKISEATVKAHVKALFRKMKVTSRTQAAIRASVYLGAGDHSQVARGSATSSGHGSERLTS